MTDEELIALFDRNEAKIDELGHTLRGEMRALGDGLRLELRGEMRAQSEELRGEMRAQGEELRGEMRAQGEELRGEMRAQGEELRGEMRAQGEELRGEMRAQGEELRGEIHDLRSEMLTGHAELRRHFDVTVEHFDAKYDLLAEGIMNLNEKMDRNNADIRAEMRQGFADTHDLIKYAYNLARQPR